MSVAGFPLGASPVAAKIVECRHALDHGAGELDIVIPIWAAVAGELALVEEELARILEATRGATRKLILEVALLPPPVLEQVAGILNRLKPEYAKTGTGYCRPVTPADIINLRRLLDPAVGIKAAGGIRTCEQAEALVAAGAARLGTSRAAAILSEGTEIELQVGEDDETGRKRNNAKASDGDWKRDRRGCEVEARTKPPRSGIHPLTPERWDDLVALFGEKGACAGCWCMYWRRKHSEFARLKGSGNRTALRRLVSSGMSRA